MAGRTFQQTVENQKLIDELNIKKCIINVHLGMGNKDEKIILALQQVDSELQTIKQKMRTSAILVDPGSNFALIINKCEAYCKDVQERFEMKDDNTVDQQNFSKTIHRALETIKSLESTYVNEVKIFQTTALETKTILDQYVLYSEQKTMKLRSEMDEFERQSIAKNEQWETSEKIEWSERQHRFKDSLDQWIQQFLIYQNATIALISIHPTLRSRTSMFRSLREDFISLLLDRNNNNTNPLSSMFSANNGSSDTLIATKICGVIGEWVSMVKPIIEDIVSYRKSIKDKIIALRSKIDDMKKKEELCVQMIKDTHSQEKRYFDSISHAKRIQQSTLDNHQMIKTGLIELESRQKKDFRNRKMTEQHLARMESLYKNTMINPPDNILEQLSEEENQLLLQKQVIGEVMSRNMNQMIETRNSKLDAFIHEMTNRIVSDYSNVLKDRDQLFSESLSRVNPDIIGGKEIGSFLSQLECTGKILGEETSKLILFKECTHSLQSYYFMNIQKCMVEMN